MILTSVKLTKIIAHSMPPALTKMDCLNANVMMVTTVMVLPVKVILSVLTNRQNLSVVGLSVHVS